MEHASDRREVRRLDYPLYIEGKKLGTLQVEQSGDRFILTAECRNNDFGLYKAYVNGGGSRRLLGTMVPEGNRLRLRRVLSGEEAQALGPVLSGEAVLSYRFPAGEAQPAGWQPEPLPSRLFQDAILAEAARELTGALVREETESRLLALPFDGGAFPLTPLFCFARIRYLAGRPYAVFRLGKTGMPDLSP